MILFVLALLAPLSRLGAQEPQFTLRSEVNLLSVSVRVTDSSDNEVRGLRPDQFSLYEDGVAQKIAFFEAEGGAVSLGLLLDVSGSMGEEGKLDQAKSALARLVGAVRPQDEMLFLRFHQEVERVVDFTHDRGTILRAVAATMATQNSTSLYDSVARALCYMRAAHNHRQALVVVTDGTDQNSHRSLADLIPIVQASQAQVFIIGALGEDEYERDRKARGEKIMLVTRQEVDNPLKAFNELAAESGAESFFAATPVKFQSAMDAVAHQLQTQYLLAYYPTSKGNGFHSIEVRVAQAGVRVRARRGFAGLNDPSAGCENEKLKPYPYEEKVATTKGCTAYREDFQDAASGWPSNNKQGYSYKAGTYQIVTDQYKEASFGFDFDHSSWGAAAGNNVQTGEASKSVSPEGILVANGPWFAGNLNASMDVEWKSTGGADDSPAPGLVFRLGNRGYYAVVLSRDAPEIHGIAFKLVKKYHSEPVTRDLLLWKELPAHKRAKQETISVQCRGPVITILFQGAPVAKFEDAEFKEGQVGMVLYGKGRAIFHDLRAEEVCVSGQALPGGHAASAP
jgi:VWFA-related protein